MGIPTRRPGQELFQGPYRGLWRANRAASLRRVPPAVHGLPDSLRSQAAECRIGVARQTEVSIAVTGLEPASVRPVGPPLFP